MPKRSIKAQVLLTLITAMFIISVVVGGISIYEVEKLIGENFSKSMQSNCERDTVIINDMLKDAEKTAQIMEKYAIYEINESANTAETDQMAKMKQVFLNVAKSSDNIAGVYFTGNPDIATLNGAYRFVKQADGEFKESQTVKKETAQPLEWQDVYYDEEMQSYLNAYEVPIYIGEGYIGTVGIEVDNKVFVDVVDKEGKEGNGFAYLVKDGKIVYHKKLQPGTAKPDTSNEFLEISGKLNNGTDIVYAASYTDMEAMKYSVSFKIWGIVIVIAMLFLIFAFVVVRRIVKPIKKLTQASEEISKGNYNINIEKSNTKEISVLSAAFEKMAQELRENDLYMHRIAYRDPLTKLRNAASYRAWAEEFDVELKLRDMDFGVVVLDINGLKETNDTLGHEVGNKLIFTAAQIISEVFRKSPVFRIGGDEFVVVLTGVDLDNSEKLLADLTNRCSGGHIKAGDRKIAVSIAKGVAFFNREEDEKFTDVFNRADDAMYIDKRRIKEGK